LVIEISDSVLDLKTKLLTSKERSSIKRTDFNISGDSLEFDTSTRSGKLIGNVKMVVTGLVPAAGKKTE
jgi:lipopolysaccharide export system protein LptC